MDQQTPAQNRFQQLAAQRRANLGQPAPAAPPPAAAPPPPPPVQQHVAPTNSFGAPVAPAVATAPRTRRAPAQAAPPPPPPVQQAPEAGAGPTYKFTIECSDPAELAAIVDIVSQALAQ
jgi:hypothetical protein